MDRISDIVLDTPSAWLGELGITSSLLLFPTYLSSARILSERSRIISLDHLDGVIRWSGCFCILREGPSATWGLMRLQDQAGSKIECLTFYYDIRLEEYFCEFNVEASVDRLRRLSVASLRINPHRLLPFENLLTARP